MGFYPFGVKAGWVTGWLGHSDTGEMSKGVGGMDVANE